MARAGCELVGALFSPLMAVSDFSRVGSGGFLSKFSLFSPVVFDFCWDDYKSLETSKTMRMQKVLGKTRCTMGMGK